MDDVLNEVIGLLYGTEPISKAEPSQSDLATHDRKKRALTAGLSAVGAGAGAAGLAFGGHKLGQAYRGARAVKGVSRMAAAKHAVSTEKFGTALVPLEVAGLGGELMATKILHGDTKKKQPLKKDLGDILNQAKDAPKSKHELTQAVITSPKVRKKGMEYTRKGTGYLKKIPTGATGHADVEKADVTWEGEFAKIDDEKQQVFGWASVIEVNGEPVLDLQGDLISVDEMEKAAYSYVQKSRKGGDMHLRDGFAPIQKSEMIESFIVTEEKRQAMGLPNSVPTGWWVGFQVEDPEHWQMIKDGRRTGFSIHGHGRRTPADA